MGRSSEPDISDQARRGTGQGLQHIPTLLSRSRENRADDGEILRAILGAKSAGDLLAQFHHAPILLGQVVGEGHAGIGQEAQNVVLAGAQAQQEVMANSSRGTATASGFCQSGLSLVERDRKSTRLNSSHITRSRMPSSA